MIKSGSLPQRGFNSKRKQRGNKEDSKMQVGLTIHSNQY
jgi:hypothetical protein